MKRLSMASTLIVGALTLTGSARAKEFGLHTPGGREIYDPHERFGQVLDQNRRRCVMEVATGAGPEGNLAMLLGVLNLPLPGFELYVGAGLEANPARHYTGTLRLFPDFGDFRPYLGVGYLYNDTYAIGVASHNVFMEAGHKWVLHTTYHFTVGVGVRRLLALRIAEDSILNDPDVDRKLLDEQIDNVMPRWLPTVALRFSRAF